MPKLWIKLHRKILYSPNLNKAANESGLAEQLFFRMLIAADDYGRLPRDPWELKGYIGPLLSEEEERIAEALSVLSKHKLTIEYEADSRQFLYLNKYHDYQSTDWSKVGSSEFPAPPGWADNPPASLVTFLAKAGHNPQFPASRYGLDDKSNVAASEINQGGASQAVSLGNLDVDVDVEVEIEKETPTRAREGNYNQKPYNTIEVSAMLKNVVEDDIWSALVFRWPKPIADILNASSEELTLSELYDMLKQDPPTLTDKWPDTYIAKLKRDRAADPMGALIRRFEKE